MSKSNQKSNFHYFLSTGYGIASWQSSSTRLVRKHTVQSCVGGELMATYINLTDSGSN